MALTMNYTYRIYPSVTQQELMLSWLETCRRLYNRCLRDLKDWMNSRKCPIDRCSLSREYIMSSDIPFPGYIEQKRQLTQWKKTEAELKAVHSQVTQDVVKRLHNSWEAFKQRERGFPRFKKYGRSLTKFGGTETDTATAVAPLGETPRLHCHNFPLFS